MFCVNSRRPVDFMIAAEELSYHQLQDRVAKVAAQIRQRGGDIDKDIDIGRYRHGCTLLYIYIDMDVD